MCGRFTLRTPADAIAAHFGLGELSDLRPRFNIAPTQWVPILRSPPDGGPGPLFTSARWGLIPHWAKDASIGARMINARSETVAEKPSFRTPFRRRRCLIPADGFYEWRRARKARTPYYFRMRDDAPFAFAALWERWDGPDETIESCTILTTTANELVAAIHERMPVILPPDAYAAWLDPSLSHDDHLLPLHRPYDADNMVSHRVSRDVNSPKHDEPDCIAPVDDI